ncbi:trypsin-like serine protease [Microbacterium sp. 1P06AB]|uniref:trypsin-like serine protease n=1 Tax=Microbacterium sp. 1P06AB TaxID=3132289 RepID=UPI0039A51FBB
MVEVSKRKSWSITESQTAVRVSSVVVAVAAAIALAGCATEETDTDMPQAAYVALINPSADDSRLWENAFCGGALLSETLVVTATHCLDKNTLPDVVIGRADLCSSGDTGLRRASVRRVDGSGDASEATLLELDRSVSLEAVPLGHPIPDAGTAIATGWGRIREAEARPCEAKEIALVEDRDRCESIITSAEASGIRPGSSTCMVPVDVDNTCVGDSGSGIFSQQQNGFRLTGITLGGTGCGADDPGLYLDTNALKSILEQAKP